MPEFYPFDSEGVQPANRIFNEPHSVNTRNGIDHNYIVPKMSPFYERSMVIVDADTGQALSEDEDFYFGYKYGKGTDEIGAPVAGAIVFIDPDRTGSYFLTYRTIGGNFVDAAAAYIQDGIDTIDALLNRDWDNIANVPTEFPLTAHKQRVDSIEGITEFIQSVKTIEEAVRARPRVTVSDVAGLDEEYIQPLMANLTSIAEAIAQLSGPSSIAALTADTCGESVSGDRISPEAGVWYDTSVTVTVVQGGVYNLTMVGNPQTTGSRGMKPANLRWAINDVAMTRSRLATTMVTLQAGSTVTLQVMSDLDGVLNRILFNGATYGIGLTLTRLRSL